ncbi:DUF418 domain-containing protein [Nonomuraea sp. NPDC050540]|uniref:DUF418 domain-containing protein n=1 Tax=Nonomuraea sp. NPDC050540 TaxID=3364367 RepID=UPI0037A898FF
MTASATLAAPLSTTARSLAPDLARGIMLLGIALAHAPQFLLDWTRGSSALNTIAHFFTTLVTDNQARGMFVFLFGYGLGQLAQRQYARGSEWPSVRALLRRRSLWLIVIGLAHAVVLVPFDVIAVYGVTMLFLAFLVRARDAVLWRLGLLTLIPGGLFLTWQSVQVYTTAAEGSPFTIAKYMEPTFVDHLLTNAIAWPGRTLVSILFAIPGMAWGLLAARKKILDEPGQHMALLKRIALLCIGAAVVGRLPAAFLAVGTWPDVATPVVWVTYAAHSFTGYIGGIGAAAAIGLAAVRIGHNHGPLTTALAALGQRSMTFYLAQSVVWVALFYPFTLGLRDDLSFAASLAVAVVIWAASIPAAAWMHRKGYRGPFEALVRRMSYR